MHINNHVVSIAGQSNLSDQTINKLNISGNAHVDHVTCTDSLTCSGKVLISSSRLCSVHISGSAEMHQSTAEEITLSGRLRAENCPELGIIKASGQLDLINCMRVSQITASGSLSLLSSLVQGDVIHTGRDLQMNGSRIAGNLTCCDQHVSIHQSAVNSIIVKKAEGNNFSFNLKGFSFNLNIGSGIFNFFKQDCKPVEQVVELNGSHCVVNTILFEEGVIGRVILKNGAKITGQVLRGTVLEA